MGARAGPMTLALGTFAAADVTPPGLASAAPNAVEDGLSVSVSFDEVLNTGNLPSAGAFTVTADGEAIAVSGVDRAADADTVEL